MAAGVLKGIAKLVVANRSEIAIRIMRGNEIGRPQRYDPLVRGSFRPWPLQGRRKLSSGRGTRTGRGAYSNIAD